MNNDIQPDGTVLPAEFASSGKEHLAWCKRRAMEYVSRGDYPGAVVSMLSDLGKHPETQGSAGGICAQLGVFELMNRPTRESITRYIQGFN